MNKPAHLFLFLFALGALMLGLSFLSPKEKWQVGPFEIGYYTTSELLGTLWSVDSTADKAIAVPENPGLDALIEETDTATAPLLSEETQILPVAVPVVLDTAIQLVDVKLFAPFFGALERLSVDRNARVRVLHFGDSQLEGDRITMQLRDAYQRKYGGTGFGYVALQPLVAPSSLAFDNEEGLVRKTVFGRRDTAFSDMKYGHLGSFTLLEPNDSGQFVGSIAFKKRKWGYSRARNFTTSKMHLEGESPTVVQILVADSIYSTRIFPSGEWTLAIDVPGEDEFSMRIGSEQQVRIYGISFESPFGFHADNVAMRGASGMIFTKMNGGQFKSSLEREAYDLIILQFGGNAVPYLKDEAHVGRFARALARQADYLKRLYPDAAFLFIGPSDMARKNGLVFESYPLLEELTHQLRNELLSRGIAFWDLYDVMGGSGSMVKWVDAKPALAVRDYIHFTPKGASKVGGSLVQALEVLEDQYNALIVIERAEAERLADSVAIFNQMNQGTGAATGSVE